VFQASHQSYQTLDFSRFIQCQVVLDGRKAFCREAIEALGMRYISIGNSATSYKDNYSHENCTL